MLDTSSTLISYENSHIEDWFFELFAAVVFVASSVIVILVESRPQIIDKDI